ncbi:MAG: 5-methyltetrahydropteroyltriglutamate--homocysteine S-methyltransferase [Pseudolabrys sp.]|nr:5-methyltetrahydropteroyltriglutamate--homocysteine S-methyltransferase [Pseudolabrys sp.]
MSAPSQAATHSQPSAAPRRPPFRADHVGSLLRPEYLKEAREQAERGEITREALRAIEDRAIREVVKLQEDAGLQSITDGEFRRAFWHVDFLSGFDGIEWTHGNYAVSFKGEGGAVAQTSSMLVVNGKVKRSKPIMVDHFAYLKSVAHRTPKFCIPSPTYMHMRGGRKVVGKTAYPDMAEFWADVVSAYRAEIADLRAAGCTYLQLDDVSFATMCDPSIQKQIGQDGEDPASLAVLYCDIINAITKGRDPSHAVTMHTCRGNAMSMWMAEGGYDPVAETLFNRADVDGFFLEYDTERAGGFEPLRFVPKGKKIVLGLVSSKRPELETKDYLKRRIEAATKYVPLEDLCLSPQCGFASSHHGNKITEEIERRKLALVVEVADEVWGGR